MVMSAQEQYWFDPEQSDVDFIDFEQAVSAMADIDSRNEEKAIGLERLYAGICSRTNRTCGR